MSDIDPFLRRIPPHSIEAECAVIGGILMDNSAAADAVTVLRIDGSDFYHSGHRLIFQAIMRLINKGGVADLLTVCHELRDTKQIDKVGGEAYIAGILDATISSANVRHYAKIVKGHTIRRIIIREGAKLIEGAYSQPGGEIDVLEQAQRAIMSLTVSQSKNTLQNARELAKNTFAEIEQRHKHGGIITGIPTGLTDFDGLSLGLNPGDLIIIAGRPGMGKTALSSNIAYHVTMQQDKTVIIFSLEMPGSSLMMRFLAGHTGIDSRHLRRGFVGDAQWPGLTQAASEISNIPLFVDDQSDITPAELRAKARRMKSEHGLDLLIVDYIQLMRVPGKHDTREQAVAEISRTLKAIARELNIPVIGLSQLNRQVDSRPDKHPLLSDLRESGAIEQDADVIAFIYRDEVYHKSADNPERGTAEIEIAKQRNGPTGRFKVLFDPKTQTFKDMQHDQR